MTFIDGPGRLFEADDVSLATEVASRTGVALSNATRFQREHVVAEVLQRAVLPDSLPDVDGLVLDAEYRAGVAGTYAGGDWYDVFELGHDAVFFSVGDVMGKGAPAAALMGQVRSAIRAYAVSGQSPTEVLVVARRPLRHPRRGPGRHRRRGDHHTVDRTGRSEQRRPPAAAGRARRRQRHLLPDAALAAHRGGAERGATTPGRARARPRRLAHHVFGRADRTPGRAHHRRHGAAGRHRNGDCAERDGPTVPP